MSKKSDVVRVRDYFDNTDNWPGLDCSADPSLTDQSAKDECDINVILRRAETTGVLPTNARQPIFDDVSEIPDFYEASNIVIQAQEAFMSLTATVRAKFDNDPGKLLQFVADKGNYDEAVRLGLIEKKLEPKGSPDPAPKGGQQGKPAAGGGPIKDGEGS